MVDLVLCWSKMRNIVNLKILLAIFFLSQKHLAVRMALNAWVARVKPAESIFNYYIVAFKNNFQVYQDTGGSLKAAYTDMPGIFTLAMMP